MWATLSYFNYGTSPWEPYLSTYRSRWRPSPLYREHWKNCPFALQCKCLYHQQWLHLQSSCCLGGRLEQPGQSYQLAYLSLCICSQSTVFCCHSNPPSSDPVLAFVWSYQPWLRFHSYSDSTHLKSWSPVHLLLLWDTLSTSRGSGFGGSWGQTQALWMVQWESHNYPWKENSL